MMNEALSIAGLFTILAAVVLWQAIEALRRREPKRFWEFLAIGLPLALAACGAFWLGAQYPNANFWHNQGFGPGWECRNLGGGAAQVCAQDVPPDHATSSKANRN